MKNMLNESNPLKSGPGKGSAARNLSKKFRKNYDDIDWGKLKIRKGSKIIGNVNPGSKMQVINGKVYILHPDHAPRFIENGEIKDVKL